MSGDTPIKGSGNESPDWLAIEAELEDSRGHGAGKTRIALLGLLAKSGQRLSPLDEKYLNFLPDWSLVGKEMMALSENDPQYCPTDEERTESGNDPTGLEKDVKVEGDELRTSSLGGDERLVSSKGVSGSSSSQIPWGRASSRCQLRADGPGDVDFPAVGSILASVSSCKDQEWVFSTFYPELVRELSRDIITYDHLSLRIPSVEDRAHDSEKGLCVY